MTTLLQLRHRLVTVAMTEITTTAVASGEPATDLTSHRLGHSNAIQKTIAEGVIQPVAGRGQLSTVKKLKIFPVAQIIL